MKDMDIKRVMLINPPVLIERTDKYEESYGALPPIGLGYLAAVLEKNGYEVKILDAVVEGFTNFRHEYGEFYSMGLSWGLILESILDFNPDVVGVSFMFTKNLGLTCQLVRWLNGKIGVPIIAGGVAATMSPREIMEKCPVDCILKGEAEYSLLDLLNRLNRGEDIRTVDGLVYYRDGELMENEKRDYIQNLDDLPFPAYHLMNMEKYESINRPYGQKEDHPRQSPAFPIQTSRSCAARCCFCEVRHMMGPRPRMRSPENVLAEIEMLVEKYGCKELLLMDDNVLSDAGRAERMFDMIAARNPEWRLTIKPMNGIALWSMTERLMRKMRECGFYRLDFAVESGNKRVLHEIIHKPLDLGAVPGWIEMAKEFGFYVHAMFVIGFPGETKAEIMDTVAFAERLDADSVNFAIATPFPGTELHETCARLGYLKDLNPDHLRFGRATFGTPDFTPQWLEETRRNEWVRINFTRKGFKPPN